MDANPAQAWMEAIDGIERSVQQSLLRASDLPTPAAPAPITDGPLHRLSRRLDAWGEGLARLEAEAAAATRELEADAVAVRDWARELARLRMLATERA